MPDWDDIFNERGKLFIEPHSDMIRIAGFFRENHIKRILDLGCGTGRHLIFFSKLGFDIYGFDASSRALEIARNWLDEEGLDVKVLHHKMEDRFPYENEFFDAIISIQVIHHNLMSDILFTVHEIERVIKPSGMIFITVPIDFDQNSQYYEVEKGTYIFQNGLESGIPHHYFTIEEIIKVFKSFKLLEIFIDNYNHWCILGIKM